MAYKVIHDTFWTDPKIKKLKPEIKLLYLYLITNHHSHYSGIYYLPLDMISLETGMTKKVIKASFDILIKLRFIKHDESMAIIWIINMAKYQINGTKQIKGAANHLATLHNCTLIKEFLELYNTLAIPYRYPIEGVYGEYHKEEEEETVTEEEDKVKRFTPPSLEEIKDYCFTRQNNIDANKFINHYESNGWMVGKNKMKSWKAAVRTWESNSLNGGNNGQDRQARPNKQTGADKAHDLLQNIYESQGDEGGTNEDFSGL